VRPADARSQDAAQVLEGLMVPTCAPAIMDFGPIIGKAVDAIGTLAFGFASYGWAIGGRVVGVHVVRSYFQGSCGLVFFVFVGVFPVFRVFPGVSWSFRVFLVFHGFFPGFSGFFRAFPGFSWFFPGFSVFFRDRVFLHGFSLFF